MGCISSKVLARSISFHEERKKGTQRTRSKNGIPLLEDIIISANNSSDHHYLALVLHSKSFSSNAASKLDIIDDEPANSETIDKLEISSSSSLLVEEDQEGGKQIGTAIDQRKRSKSCCHLFLPEHDFPSLSQENSSGFEVGSRSFHTVEEYDDLVKKLSEFNNISESALSRSSTTTHDHTDDKMIVNKWRPSARGSHQVGFEEGQMHATLPVQAERMFSGSEPVTSTRLPSSNLTVEKGNKRKAMSKRLESLRIPSSSSSNNIECAAINGSLREWIPPSGNNIYSPGSYVTPKFGSYSSSSTSSKMAGAGRNIACESSEDSSIFSPELVSAFEECMQKLEADEENILKQIMDNSEEESNGGEMKSQEINS